MYYYHVKVRGRIGKGIYTVNQESKFFDSPKEALSAGREYMHNAKEDFGNCYRGGTLAIFDEDKHVVDVLDII